MVECRYRGRVIGWLVEGRNGFLRYEPVAYVDRRTQLRRARAAWRAS